MEIRFWGVRGSVAVSGSQVAHVGGNTACVEVTSGDTRLILDSGTGIRGLGEAMLAEGKAAKVTMLFSHLHWDHVQGFPFFTPAFLPTTELELYGPGVDGASALHAVLDRQMQPPTFPVTLEAMGSTRRFHSAAPGEAFEVGPFVVRPFALPHPDGCVGYRIEADGRSFVYATDVETSWDSLPEGVARHFEGADALCLDAQYTEDEYEGRGGVCKRGWGHSTVLDAARIARGVNAKQLYLFHHDPGHDDARVASMAEEARAVFPNAEPAREGLRIHLAA